MKLTKREIEIIPLLLLTHGEIAEKLYISKGTVKTHITNLKSKFPEQKNRYAIVIESIKRGVITIEEIVTN